MSQEFSVVIERDEEGYYVASVPALTGCYTQARSLDHRHRRQPGHWKGHRPAPGSRGASVRFPAELRICRRPARAGARVSGKLPSLTGPEVIRALERTGFAVVRVRSSHHSLRHADGRTTMVPVHAGETIGPGLMSKILRDCGLSREEFRALLD